MRRTAYAAPHVARAGNPDPPVVEDEDADAMRADAHPPGGYANVELERALAIVRHQTMVLEVQTRLAVAAGVGELATDAVAADVAAVHSQRAALERFSLARVETARQELEQAESALAEQRATLDTRRTELVEDRRQLRRRIAALRRREALADAKLDQTTARLAAEREILAAREQALNAAGRLLTRERELADERLASLDAARDELERAHAAFEARTAELETRERRLEQAQAELAADREDVQARGESLDSVAATRDELEQKRAELEARGAELAARGQQLDEARAQLDVESQKLAARAEIVTEQQGTLRREANRLGELRLELERERIRLVEERARADERLAALDAREHELDRAGAGLEARLAELEAERARVREALAHFSEALAATHDSKQLLRIVAAAAAEATAATSCRIVSADGSVVTSGDSESDGERLILPLTAGGVDFGTLELVGDSFDQEQRLNAASLASHAVVALENARLHAMVERQALVDSLTGLANRRASAEALQAELARAGRLGTPLSVVLVDLDGFKDVNDAHGHSVGDEVLRAFADVLRETLRDSDIAGRWGGEEFLLLLPGADEDGAVHLAERVRTGLSSRAIPGAPGLRVTASFGVAEHRSESESQQLVAAADEALYRAKRAGKDRIERGAAEPSRL